MSFIFTHMLIFLKLGTLFCFNCSKVNEEDLEELLKESRFVIADPFYREVLPAAASLSPLPHQAFSGRNGWKTARDLLTLEPEMLL